MLLVHLYKDAYNERIYLNYH